MQLLTINHTTEYRYARPVTFGEHKLMFRPLGTHDLRLSESYLSITPKAKITWHHDVFGNSIAEANFDGASDILRFESRIVVEHYASHAPKFELETHALNLPFGYTAEEYRDLGSTTERHYLSSENTLEEWTAQFLDREGPTETEAFLKRITEGIKAQLIYENRHEEGTQSPARTLQKGSGTCRDFALLMMEAVRRQGMAARFVSGYLYDPAIENRASQTVGAGATHAWVQVFLPGAGWVEFDPTNGRVGSGNLVRVAVARDPSQAIPIQGTYFGASEDYLGMSVDVVVTCKDSSQVKSMAAGQ